MGQQVAVRRGPQPGDRASSRQSASAARRRTSASDRGVAIEQIGVGEHIADELVQLVEAVAALGRAGAGEEVADSSAAVEPIWAASCSSSARS